MPQAQLWHPQPHTTPCRHRAGKETHLVSVYFTAIGFVQICIYTCTYKSLCRGTEAPTRPCPPRPFLSLGTTQELKCIVARERGERSSFPRGLQPSPPSRQGGAYRGVWHPPAALLGHHKHSCTKSFKVQSHPALCAAVSGAAGGREQALPWVTLGRDPQAAPGSPSPASVNTDPPALTLSLQRGLLCSEMN